MADHNAEIERVYHDAYPRFLRVAHGVLGDVDHARDAVHEAFVVALTSQASLKRAQSVEPWIWRILVNVCRTELRRRKRSTDLNAPRESNATAPDEIEIRALVARLPERQRVVLFLRYYADLDHRQIAETLGIARGTVAATLHQAQQSIKTLLQEVDR